MINKDKKIWVRKARSFSESEEQDLDYYLAMSPQERVEIVQFLGEQYLKFAKVNVSESGKRLEDLLGLLNKHNVKYCIIGSYALAFHARPRYTKDIDILVGNSIENAQKILDALNEFGFGSLQLTEEDFTEPGQIIQLGYEPVRVDL